MWLGSLIQCSGLRVQAEAMQEVNLLELRPNLQSARAAPDTIMPVVPPASSTEEANGHSNHGTRLNTKLVHPSKGQSTVTSLMKLVDPASTPRYVLYHLFGKYTRLGTHSEHLIRLW